MTFDFKAVDKYGGDGEVLTLHPPFSARKPSIKDVYKPQEGLLAAADVAMILGTPLLLTGEPGSGKTSAAFYLAGKLGAPKRDPLEHNVKSSSSAKDLLYSFDEVARFRDSTAHEGKQKPLASYLRMNALGEAIIRAAGGGSELTDLFGRPLSQVVVEEAFGKGTKRPTADLLLAQVEDDPVLPDAQVRLVLLDEIDKAARDTPNDLLVEIENMSFAIPELGVRVAAASEVRPIVLMTSNSERSLPEPFLRRCAFFNIPIPGEEKLKEIVTETFASISFVGQTVKQMVKFFFAVRGLPGISKQPSTSELVAWVDAVSRRNVLKDDMDFESGRKDEEASKELIATLGALVKKPEDLELARAELTKEG